jgi:hypothetical protein
MDGCFVQNVEGSDLWELDLVVGALDHAVLLDDVLDAVGFVGALAPGAHPRLEPRSVRFLWVNRGGEF